MCDKKSILVIDDSPFIFKAVKRALEPRGFQIIDNALNGKVGLELIDKYKPDLITLDITMPVMDGLETAEAIFDMYPEARVIMMSAMGDESLINQARELGVKQFITKPFKPDQLYDAVINLIGGE